MENVNSSIEKENNVDCKELSILDLYSLDVKNLPCLDSEGNRKLLIEVRDIIQQLDIIFSKIGCDDKILGGGRIPWIADKYEYSIKHCNNIGLLEKLKILYNKYLLVSNKIIEGNLRLVMIVANDYKPNQFFSLEDIIQCGNIGLIRAIEKYNLDCDTTFSTYARKWISQSIIKNIRGVMSAYRIPLYYVYENCDRMNACDELCMKLDREPTIIDVAHYVGKSVSEIDMMRVAFNDSVSLDETFDLQYSDEKITRGDIVADPNVDVFTVVNNNLFIEELNTLLSKYLTPRQFEVMQKYFGLDGISYNLNEISAMLNISSQRVAEIKRDSIKKLSRNPSFMKIISNR